MLKLIKRYLKKYREMELAQAYWKGYNWAANSYSNKVLNVQEIEDTSARAFNSTPRDKEFNRGVSDFLRNLGEDR